MGEEITLDADLVVLSTPVVPQDDADDTSKLLRVPVDENGRVTGMKCVKMGLGD